jgi:membrane protease YdiL (CAAX protease family)
VTPGALVRLIVWIGLILFWAAFYILAAGAGLDAADGLLVATLLVGLPALSFAQLPLARQAGDLERIPAYGSSIVALWAIGGAAWWVGTRDSGAEGLGLIALPASSLAGWTLTLTAAALAITVAFRGLTLRLGRADPRLLHFLLPRTPGEKAVFGLLSVSAGAAEEVAYRGYLIITLAPVLGTLWAAVASTLVFGIIHAYQGTIGVARTGAMGAVLAWGFLASGSLWPPIVAHTLIDLLAGIVFGKRLLVHGSEDSWK